MVTLVFSASAGDEVLKEKLQPRPLRSPGKAHLFPVRAVGAAQTVPGVAAVALQPPPTPPPPVMGRPVPWLYPQKEVTGTQTW